MRAARHFCKDQRGNVVLMVVFLMPILLGMAGLVIDVGMAVQEKNVLLTSAEASALAAAKYVSTQDRSAALTAAQAYASRNRPSVEQLVTDVGLDFGKWDKGTFTVVKDKTANAVRVTVSRNETKNNGLKTSFARLFGLDVWDVSASAIALADASPVCILVLHPTHSDAFDIDPGAQLDAPECQVQVNSNHRGALELGSNSNVNVKSIRIVGGYDKSGSAVVKPDPVTGAEAVADPYAALQPPVNTSCGGPKRISDTTKTISPNLAFCDGLVIDNATVTFEPGIYVIKGEFTLKSGSAIKGTDVMIYLDGAGSDLFFYSKTSFDLKAPTTGTYAGIVLWSDRRNTKDHDIYSKFGAAAEGTIYTPSSQVEFENNVVWEANCIRIVVSRLELDNNSKYHASNPDANCRNNIKKSGAKLVH